MKIGPKEAQAKAEADHGAGVFVGDLDEVWEEAQRRARDAGLPPVGQINTERLDGAWWDDDNDEYKGVKDPLTDRHNQYWFVLLPEQPWDQARRRAEEKATKARTWDPETQSAHELNMALRHLYEAVDLLNHFTGLEQKITDFLDTTSLPVAEAYRDLVDRESDYPIWACDSRGFCITGEDLRGVEHIAEIYGLDWIRETGKWPSAAAIRDAISQQEEEEDPAGLARDEGPI
jgi:hypothetical protein